ncbi:Fatty acid synthase subunit alpha [Mycena kentingensis (nom. inval.)]|nr:Fatty acid synthase subunit alpha [Mycena kentingensis (nom. inval.)]
MKKGKLCHSQCYASNFRSEFPTLESYDDLAELSRLQGVVDAGIRHVSFKPGSVEGIRQVVAIAASNPDFPVILQWTDGRAGGHHSYEDFHQPVLQTYRSIRQPSNISLVGGSGFGAAEDVWPYLTCEWALKYETQTMPLDGFLFASRVTRRLCYVSVVAHTSLDDPLPFIEAFFKEYPTATKQLLAAEDSAYFHAISQRPGQKPVPFILVLDATFEVWFKNDSLWAAKNIEAVFDQDPQRVCILQGPMAVKHSKVKDEPIKEMLGNIHNELVQRLLASNRPPRPVVPCIQRAEGNNKVIYEFSNLPQTSAWLETLARPELSWLCALTTSSTIVQGTSYIDNPMKRLLAPRVGQKVVVGYNDALPVSVTVYGAARSFGEHKKAFKAVEIVYSPADQNISVTMFEDRRDISVPLTLQFAYKPSQGFAPIHEIATDRNNRIKAFYWKLWYGDNAVLPEIDIRETFHGPEVTIESDAVEQFCAIVGNQGESFQTVRNKQVAAPMDFAIVTGWQAIMKSIFPAAIDGDLLHLVHLSNGFRMVEGATPLCAGDVCKAEANIVSVANTDAGKVVKVKGHVLRADKPVIEVVSAFLYRGRFTDYENTFETTEEPNYLIKLDTDAAVTFKDKTAYSKISVTGQIFVRNHLKELVPVGTVDFQQEDGCHGNPVVAYIQRHGAAQGLSTPLPNDGYTLNSAPIVFHAPLTNEPYSQISGDFNPIHINPYFSDYASLPATITHGLWSSGGNAYNVSFVGMVIPGDQLNVKIRHVGMRDGNIVTSNERREGLGGLPGAGYGYGPVQLVPGRAVWEGADAHLLAVYGFSIVEIVKDNPKQKTIHFGGIKGQAIRRRYMDMTYDTMDKDGNVKTLPLFSDIDVRTPKYTFSHPQGLLFATQFAQIALVVTEKAAFEDMRMKGYVQKDCAFAGHSLGEYSALASIADVLAISALVDVVFYRGITMQRAVERDAQNRSNYAMCAVNPSRISKTFMDAALREVVDSISTLTGTLLEIVNYNVEGQQYVCAGELVALQTMTNVLNYLKVQKIDIAKLTETFTVDKVKEMLGDIVKECFGRAQEQQQAEGHIKLERGFATIPLPGIDVPFHSRYLWAGVMPFRAYLSKKINVAHLNPDMLIGKYIPNLIAIPFAVTKEYAQITYNQTSSPRLDKVLKKWDQENWASDEQRQKLAYIILVELLAYQFASPVRWIQTQDRLFTQFAFERLIELGPSPTLTGMATRTLKAKYEAKDDSVSVTRTILCHSKNVKEIYYQFEDEPEAAAAEPEAASPRRTDPSRRCCRSRCKTRRRTPRSPLPARSLCATTWMGATGIPSSRTVSAVQGLRPRFTLNSALIGFHAPLTNEPYSKISATSIPFISTLLFRHASLPATITHGLWSSAAATRRVGMLRRLWLKDILTAFLYCGREFMNNSPQPQPMSTSSDMVHINTPQDVNQLHWSKNGLPRAPHPDSLSTPSSESASSYSSRRPSPYPLPRQNTPGTEYDTDEDGEDDDTGSVRGRSRRGKRNPRPIDQTLAGYAHAPIAHSVLVAASEFMREREISVASFLDVADRERVPSELFEQAKAQLGGGSSIEPGYSTPTKGMFTVIRASAPQIRNTLVGHVQGYLHANAGIFPALPGPNEPQMAPEQLKTHIVKKVKELMHKKAFAHAKVGIAPHLLYTPPSPTTPTFATRFPSLDANGIVALNVLPLAATMIVHFYDCYKTGVLKKVPFNGQQYRQHYTKFKNLLKKIIADKPGAKALTRRLMAWSKERAATCGQDEDEDEDEEELEYDASVTLEDVDDSLRKDGIDPETIPSVQLDAAALLSSSARFKNISNPKPAKTYIQSSDRDSQQDAYSQPDPYNHHQPEASSQRPAAYSQRPATHNEPGAYSQHPGAHSQRQPSTYSQHPDAYNQDAYNQRPYNQRPYNQRPYDQRPDAETCTRIHAQTHIHVACPDPYAQQEVYRGQTGRADGNADLARKDDAYADLNIPLSDFMPLLPTSDLAETTLAANSAARTPSFFRSFGGAPTLPVPPLTEFVARRPDSQIYTITNDYSTDEGARRAGPSPSTISGAVSHSKRAVNHFSGMDSGSVQRELMLGTAASSEEMWGNDGLGADVSGPIGMEGSFGVPLDAAEYGATRA